MILKQAKEEIIGLRNPYQAPNITLAKLSNISLEDLQEKADAIQSTAKDYKINTSKRKIAFTDDVQFKLGSNKLNITEHAFSQICSLLEVPAHYMKKCIEKNKIDLFKRNIDNWAKDIDKDLMIRTNRNIIRGIVTQNYIPYDNHEILRDITAAISDTNSQLIPVGAYLSEDRMNIRLIDINKPVYIQGDESPLYFGINVTNSNIGTSSTSIKFFIYRQWCKNGCTINEGSGILYKQSHAGKEHKFMRRLKFQSAIQNIDLLRDNIEMILQESRKKELSLNEMQMLIDKMKKKVTLSEKAANSIIEVAQQKYGSTKHGIINGITEVAQEYDLDTRLQFEQYAGELLLK